MKTILCNCTTPTPGTCRASPRVSASAVLPFEQTRPTQRLSPSEAIAQEIRDLIVIAASELNLCGQANCESVRRHSLHAELASTWPCACITKINTKPKTVGDPMSWRRGCPCESAFAKKESTYTDNRGHRIGKLWNGGNMRNVDTVTEPVAQVQRTVILACPNLYPREFQARHATHRDLP